MAPLVPPPLDIEPTILLITLLFKKFRAFINFGLMEGRLCAYFPVSHLFQFTNFDLLEYFILYFIIMKISRVGNIGIAILRTVPAPINGALD